VTVGCLFMPGVITENSSGKQVCCLCKRAVKERERLSYAGPFVMQGLEMSEKGEVSESRVKQLTPSRTAKVQQVTRLLADGR